MRLKQRTYVSQRYTVTLKHLSSSTDCVVCRKTQPQQLSGICTHIKSGGQKSAYVFLYLPFHHLFFYDSIHRLNGWSEQFSETIRFSRAFWREKCMFSLCHFARVRYEPRETQPLVFTACKFSKNKALSFYIKLSPPKESFYYILLKSQVYQEILQFHHRKSNYPIQFTYLPFGHLVFYKVI